MKIVCLDLEGVLIPEIWQHVATRTQISDLNLTTRDIADYRELMDYRVDVCQKNGITLKAIQNFISELQPMTGAVDFLDNVKSQHQLIILSDTFYEFSRPLMKLLGYPTLFCHSLYQEGNKLIYKLRQEDQKRKSIEALQSLNFTVFAAGDSYNDLSMIKTAQGGCLFRAPAKVADEHPQFKNTQNYMELQSEIDQFFASLNS